MRKEFSPKEKRDYAIAQKERMDTIFKQLQEGVKGIFESNNYIKFLNTMAKFHNYSFNNTLLIAMQKPDASLVAGYGDWQKNFHRQVKKGEKGITIIAPAPYKKKEVQEVVGKDGKMHKEEVETLIPAYRAVKVFDISQTDGEELPSLGVDELVGEVEGYQDFIQSLMAIAPVPVKYELIEGDAKGYFSPGEQCIVVKEGMSELQTIKTLIHEIAHAILHNKKAIDLSEEEAELVIKLNETIDSNMGAIPVLDYLMLRAAEAGFDDYVEMFNEGVRIEGYEDITPHIIECHKKLLVAESDRKSKEVQAESTAYVVCQHYGLDTSDYSFGYIAGWSSGKETKELKASMDTIRKTADSMISKLGEQLRLQKEKRQELERQEQQKQEKKQTVSKKKAKVK